MVDWPTYNETLVRRGQVLLDFDVVDRWDLELSQMNLGKVGEPYCYPDSFIDLLGYMRAYFHLPYRQTQGVVMDVLMQITYQTRHTIVPLVDA
jgi:Transposase DDE domain